MTDYTKLTDTKNGRRLRQQRRRQALNKKAKSLGYGSWGKLETAVINGLEIKVLKEGDKFVR